MLIRALGLCLLASAARAEGAVHVVGPVPGPGVDFTSIGAAVAASSDGDTILVDSGSYPAFAINGRSLAIAARTGASVEVTGAVFVIGVPADGFVSLSGLQLHGDDFGSALNLFNDHGPVWVEACTLRGFDQEKLSIFLPGTEALTATNCDSVVLTGCTLQGGAGLSGEPALASESTTLHLFGSTVTGGPGHCEDLPSSFCGDAGPALRITGGFVTVQSCTLIGGAAAPGATGCPECPCVQSGLGGAALELVGGAPIVDCYDVTLQAGAATPPCGAPGADVAGMGNGTLAQTQGPAFALSGGGAVTEDTKALLHATGTHGDKVWVLVSLHPTDGWVPMDHGALLIEAATLLPLGHISAAGTLDILVRVPLLPAGVEGTPFALQGLRESQSGDILLGNPLRPIVIAAGI